MEPDLRAWAMLWIFAFILRAIGGHRCIWSREGTASEMVRTDWIVAIGDPERQIRR